MTARAIWRRKPFQALSCFQCDPIHSNAVADWDWDRAAARCLREARRYLRSDADAQEAAQEALLRAWRNRSSCTNPADPMPWMLTITRNEALRRLARRRETLLEDPAEVLRGEWSPELERLPLRLDLERAMSGLSDDDRILLDLRYTEDLTQEAVAERLSIPEGTVKVRLHRLRHRLRETLQS
jgi:RNA polymerase sigma-70 factor (ECF subfamily)